jgi:hypothetical protein
MRTILKYEILKEKWMSSMLDKATSYTVPYIKGRSAVTGTVSSAESVHVANCTLQARCAIRDKTEIEKIGI